MRLNRLHVIPVRGCAVGVVGPIFSELTLWAWCGAVSGTAWDGGPEWVRVPYAKTCVVCFGGVPE